MIKKERKKNGYIKKTSKMKEYVYFFIQKNVFVTYNYLENSKLYLVWFFVIFFYFTIKIC